MKRHLYSISPTSSQPAVANKESFTQPTVTPHSNEAKTPVIIVTETQPSPTPSAQAQVPTTSSIGELAALVLVLTSFVAVIIALTKR